MECGEGCQGKVWFVKQDFNVLANQLQVFILDSSQKATPSSLFSSFVDVDLGRRKLDSMGVAVT